MGKINNFKKLIVLVTLSVMLFFAVPTVFAFAEIESNDFEKYEGVTAYHYFTSPSEIAADESNIYILDENKISVFSAANNSFIENISTQNQSVLAIAAQSGTVYTIEGGGIYKYNNGLSNQIIAKANLKNIFVDAEKIYVSDSNNIYVFSTEDYSLFATLSSPAKINCFTVLDGVIHAITEGANRLRNNVYTLEIGQAPVCALENINAVYGISAVAEQNQIALLYANKISLYSFRVNELFEDNHIEFFDAVAICYAADGLLALTGERSIIRFKSDLSGFVEILASSSSVAGFYKNPVNITTRFGKAYTTDRGNDRVSIHDGKTHSYLSVVRPISTAVDNSGTVYVAFSENKIASFDKNNTLIAGSIIKVKNNTDNEVWFSDISIIDIKLDSFDNMFLLSREGKLYIKKSTEEFFVLATDNISSIAHSSGSTEIFGICTLTNRVIKLSFDANEKLQKHSTPVITDNAIDIAIDTDNSIYLLKPNNLLERYSYLSGYNPSPDISDTVKSSGTLTKIEVSAIDNDSVKYRDIVCIDTTLATLKIISHKSLNISYDDLGKKEILPPSFKTELSKSVNLIRTVTKKGGTEVYAQSSETAVIRTLPEGFRVLVTDFNPKSKFTKIICDTVNIGSNSANEQITVGYVNTANLSEPLAYSSEHESVCHVWLHPIAVYSLPSRQAPIIEGFESVEKNTAIILLDFVTHTNDIKNTYGYKDNFPNTETINQNNIWYRVKVEKNGIAYEGFVFAASVSVLGGNPDLSIRPQTNAEIIAKSKDAPNLGAYVYYYDEIKGTYEIDIKYDLLAVGTKVEVVGKFDSSEPFTKILFYSEYGTIEAYVETANLKYQGVNFTQIIAVILIVLTVILIIVLLLRKNRKQRENIY